MTKKFLFGTMAAVTMLFASSCSNELDVVTPAEGEATVSVSLGIPELQMGSRAFSDGTTARKLQYEVYEVKSDGSLNKLEMGDTKDDFLLKDEISFRLLNDHTYKFVFWASTLSTTSPYTVNFEENGATVEADYANVSTNDENLDAFFATKDLTVTGSTKLDVELYRPFAQINIGSNDLTDMTKEEHTVTGVEVKVSNVYTKLDLISGYVSDEETVTFATAGLPQGETFPVGGYGYLAMNYVLVGQEDETDEVQKLVTVEFTATNEKNETNTRKVGNVPVQRNYRTNIYGQLFTSDLEWNVVIEPDYEKPDFNAQAQLASSGGTVKLEEDIDITAELLYQTGNTSTIDLNGHDIMATHQWTFDVRDGSTLIMKGEGNVTSSVGHLFGNMEGIIIIEGGNYESEGALFAYPSVTDWAPKGTILIKGGSFKATEEIFYVPTINGTPDVTIEITGGKFYDYDPSEYVMEGYKAEGVTIGGESWFVVVPEGTTVTNAASFKNSLSKGGDIYLAEDVVYSSSYATFTNDMNLDLGGNSLTTPGGGSYKDGAVVGNGKTVSISNGTINPPTDALSDGTSATLCLMTSGGGKLTLDNVEVIGNVYPVELRSGNASSEITINSGTFAFTNKWADSQYDNQQVAVYNSGAGKITIKGGTFGMKGVHSEFLLNILGGDNKKSDPREKIEVFGGTFYNFNPSNNRAEGEGTNFVAEGYTVVSTQDGEDVIYTVVKK